MEQWVIVLLSAFLPQAIERGPTQGSAAPDEQEGPSAAAEQGASEPDNMEVRGGRFSKSAEERQKMLRQRKEEMLQEARRFVHCLEFSTSKEVQFFGIFKISSLNIYNNIIIV